MFVRDLRAGPLALATPMGVQLLDELIARIVRAEDLRMPTPSELSSAGIDRQAVLGNFLAAQVIHLERGWDNSPEEEARIWSRLERDLFPIPN
uniref:Uncharacterized protein n=1 Tax=candidate division WWE3 bacterium TaxID=2053526 RepID=A0A832E0V5_UNCKA